ncbi:hypothetical protein GCM10027360_40160 [Amycolatopsis echigonensis]
MAVQSRGPAGPADNNRPVPYAVPQLMEQSRGRDEPEVTRKWSDLVKRNNAPAAGHGRGRPQRRRIPVGVPSILRPRLRIPNRGTFRERERPRAGTLIRLCGMPMHFPVHAAVFRFRNAAPGVGLPGADPAVTNLRA